MTRAPHVLLADDEAIFRDATADLLRREGYLVSTAPDSQSAIALLRSTSIDLLIADINMPGNYPQLDLIAEVKAYKTLLPVIIVTGHPSAQTAIDALHLSVSRYLVKPFELSELISHVRYLLKRTELHDALQTSQAQLAQQIAGMEHVPAAVQRLLSEVRTLDALLLTPQAPISSPEQRAKDLEAALLDTISTLEKTKRSFKSRELRLLREKLEALLQPPQSGPAEPGAQ